MADDQQFCLRWNNFQTNFTSQFKSLRAEEDFVDVTLACEGKRIQAHKLVLSACSPFFKELFKSNPCKHPIIFMQDVEYEHLLNLIEFMYAGQVNICENKLTSFLHTAESLHIRGLSAQSQNKLPHNSERKSTDLRPAPILKERVTELTCSPEVGIDGMEGESEGRADSHHLSKRICLPAEQSTSHSDVPTTALIETKMEPMDYYSDNDIKPSVSHISNVESHSRSGYSLQGALDAAASMSAQHTHLLAEPSHESLQDMVGEMCKLQSLESTLPAQDNFKPHSLDPRPCPECGRIYSNISNLRQHIRLIHFTECITCPLCLKPFKNKLYLRRHVMSYHEINLPSQNDLRYKLGNASFAKSEAADGPQNPQKLTSDVLAAIFGPPKSNQKFDSGNSHGDSMTMVPFYPEVQGNTGNRSLAGGELDVPSNS